MKSIAGMLIAMGLALLWPIIAGAAADSGVKPRSGVIKISADLNVTGLPAVALGPSGDAVVVWQAMPEGELPKVFASRYSADGAALGPVLSVSDRFSPSGGWLTAPNDVEADAHGNFLIAWAAIAAEAGESAGPLLGRRYAANGVPLGEPLRLSPPAPTSEWGAPHNADITMLRSGHFISTWSVTDGAGRARIQARRFDAAGSPLESPIDVVDGTAPGTHLMGRAALNEDDSFVVSWVQSQFYENGLTDRLLAQRFGADGSPNGLEIEVAQFANPLNIISRATPGIVSKANADFTICWSGGEFDPMAGYQLLMRRYGATGLLLSDELAIGPPAASISLQPDVAADRAGNMVVVWAFGDDIFVRRFAPDGTPRGDSFSVSGPQAQGQISGPPQVAMNEVGNFVVVWGLGFDTDSDGEIDRHAVYARMFQDDTVGASRNGGFQFGGASYEVSESAGSLTITVERIDGSDGDVGVNYATVPGNAVAPDDFISTSGSLHFAAGVGSQSFSVPIANDALHEDEETFSVQLSSPTGGAVLAGQSSATIKIVDDDAPNGPGSEPGVSGSLGLSQAGYSVNESAGVAIVTIIRTGGSSGRISASYATVSGTATAPDDYQNSSHTLLFEDGVTSQSISVPIIDDPRAEPTETFSVKLSADGVALLRDSATISIVDDDSGAPPDVDESAGAFSFGKDRYEVSESSPILTITVDRAGGSRGSVDLAFTVTGAGPGLYPASGTLSFLPGEISRTLQFSVLSDGAVVPSRSYTLNLQVLSDGATTGDRSQASVEILDADKDQGGGSLGGWFLLVMGVISMARLRDVSRRWRRQARLSR